LRESVPDRRSEVTERAARQDPMSAVEHARVDVRAFP
jgi:hypothetical protein